MEKTVEKEQRKRREEKRRDRACEQVKERNIDSKRTVKTSRKKRKRGHGSKWAGDGNKSRATPPWSCSQTGTARRRLIIHPSVRIHPSTGSQNGLLHGFFFWDRLKLLQSREPKMTPPRAAASRGRAGGSEEGAGGSSEGAEGAVGWAEREQVDEMGT